MRLFACHERHFLRNVLRNVLFHNPSYTDLDLPQLLLFRGTELIYILFFRQVRRKHLPLTPFCGVTLLEVITKR